MKIARINLEGKVKTVLIESGDEFFILDEGTDYYDIRDKNLQGKRLDRLSIENNEFLVPLPEITSIRDFYAFEDHVKRARARRGLEMVKEWYEIPAYYYSNTSMVYPSGSPIPYPYFTKELDYEMEVAIIIGKEGINIRREEALSYVFGMTLANDWSARDIQRKEMKIGLGPSKSKDFATSIGPYIITTDEIAEFIGHRDEFNIPVETFVNGKRYSMGNVGDMHWSFPELIEYASRGTKLRKGDVIMSGTVSSGCILELGFEEYGWLKRGDIVSIRSPVLGELVNKVV
jgi:fumarylacetoacetate (FAA) hydrolase